MPGTRGTAAVHRPGINAELAHDRPPIAAPEDAADGDPALKALLFYDLLADGFWVAQRGFLSLSLEIDDALCERFVAAVETVLHQRAGLFAAVREAQEAHRRA